MKQLTASMTAVGLLYALLACGSESPGTPPISRGGLPTPSSFIVESDCVGLNEAALSTKVHLQAAWAGKVRHAGTFYLKATQMNLVLVRFEGGSTGSWATKKGWSPSRAVALDDVAAEASGTSAVDDKEALQLVGDLSGGGFKECVDY